MLSTKYIILDRDGVINHDSPSYIKNQNEWIPIDRSLEAIALLTKHSYRVLLVSNQAGVSRGIIKYEDLIKTHNKFLSCCHDHGGKIFSTYYCYDHPDSRSKKRKPQPGMYIDIADRLGIDLTDIFAIGDSPKDIIAALSSGCKPLGVRTGNGSEIKDKMPDVSLFDDLYDAAEYVIDYDKQYILNI
jgi:D-glycero-D-manno-heptose 1,7-bisphosphate phosphatase